MLFSRRVGQVLLGLAFFSALAQVSAQETDDNLHELRTHSIYMPYIDQDLQNRWFDFGGDAYVNTYQHIRLTSDRPSQSGHLWSRLPLTASNFQVEFEFRVDGKGTGLVGDGLGVFLTKERAESGPVFGNRDRFEGLGVFFDTYANSRQQHTFPFVMAMVGDGQTSYDNENDGKANELGSCESDFRIHANPTKARITVNRSAKTVNLKIQTRDWDKWEECFTLTDVTLPTVTYLGFSAMTGGVHDNHDIISVSTSAISNPEDFTASRRKNNTPPPRDRSNVMWYLKLFAALAVFAALVVAFKMSKDKNDMKRF
ncbi:hypothetical protein BGZ81_006569 [Podila clonocystis]|nr:hypothetical protein BGZ81_006569 [Podila clonocystis]